MTNDQIRRKIAEACGWRDIVPDFLIGKQRGGSIKEVPNYPESHDAMAEALETALKSAHDSWQYVWNLKDIVGKPIGLDWTCHNRGIEIALVCATPLQKAEAFLRVKGLWEEAV